MGWNGTHTWAVSDTLTASDLNTYVRDNTAYLVQKAEVAMKKAATNLGTGTLGTVSFTAGSDDIYDTFGMHVSGAPTKLSAPSGQVGTYWAWANVQWQNNATASRRAAYLQKDGTTVLARDDKPVTAASFETCHSIGGPANVTSAGQYVELLLYQDSGVTLTYTVLNFGMVHVGS